MKIKEFDCVQLKDGRIGTVLEVFDSGKAFMVEISDSDGRAIDTPIVYREDIVKVTYSA